MANEEAKLFVAGLPDSISEDVLKQIFEANGGKVVAVSLPKDRTTGRPRGFGFVTLSTPQEALAARDALDGSLHAGKSISVRPFQAEPPKRDGAGPRSGPGPRPQQSYDCSLYVGNLPYDATEDEVRALVSAVARDGVVKVKLPTGEDGRKRGFGFVELSSPDVARAASEQLQTAELRGRRLRVNLSHPPQARGDRPPRPEGGFGGGYGAPFQPSFGGGAPHAGGPPARKPHEEKRKRSFEDGGAPRAKKKKNERDDRHGHRLTDYDDDE